MADPLSIVALGITVCQGLHFTLSAWADFSSDVLHATTQIQSLSNTLSFLKTLLEVPFDSVGTDTSQVQACLRDCQSGLDGLQRHLDKLRASRAATGFSQITGPKFQKFLYPLT